MAIESKAKGTPPGPSSNAPAAVKGKGFFHEVLVELKKTTWPTRPEAWRLTRVVIGVIVAVALYVGIIDRVLTAIFKYLIK